MDALTDRHGNEFEMRERDCPTCGVAPQRVLGLRGGRYHRYGEGVETRIVRCERCGLLFPNPFPYPRAPQKLYGDPTKYFEHHDTAQKIEGYRSLTRKLRARCSTHAPPRVLDIGAGRGDFLHAARLEGVVDFVGLEFANAMIEHAREHFGITLLAHTIESYAAEQDPEPFDAVILNAVLEHVYDPDSFIAAVAKVTKPSGVVYIDVPNEPNLMTHVGNFVAKVKRSPEVYNLQPTWSPYHVYGFNERALRALLIKHGLVLEETRIHASPTVPHDGSLRDRSKSFVAGQALRVGNWLGMGANLFAWARKRIY